MKATKIRKIITILLLSVFLFFACNEKHKTENTVAQHDTTTSNQVTQHKDTALASIYSMAIKKFIETVQLKQKINFDTLYFGKHAYGQADDFPDITLPMQINNTQIFLISPEQGDSIQKNNLHAYYINLIGNVENYNAKFNFITFTNGFSHQFDYTIDFNFDSTVQNYRLNMIEFEDYLKFQGKKPKHERIYADGKFL